MDFKLANTMCADISQAFNCSKCYIHTPVYLGTYKKIQKSACKIQLNAVSWYYVEG